MSLGLCEKVSREEYVKFSKYTKYRAMTHPLYPELNILHFGPPAAFLHIGSVPHRGYHSPLGIRIFFDKTLIFAKDKDILSLNLRIRDETLHVNNERIK